MFENPRRGRQARNFTTNVPKILDLKSSSEQIFSRKLPLGAPVKRLLRDPMCLLVKCRKEMQTFDYTVSSAFQNMEFLKSFLTICRTSFIFQSKTTVFNDELSSTWTVVSCMAPFIAAFG